MGNEASAACFPELGASDADGMVNQTGIGIPLEFDDSAIGTLSLQYFIILTCSPELAEKN
jgi:hypothetical protein